MCVCMLDKYFEHLRGVCWIRGSGLHCSVLCMVLCGGAWGCSDTGAVKIPSDQDAN